MYTYRICVKAQPSRSYRTLDGKGLAETSKTHLEHCLIWTNKFQEEKRRNRQRQTNRILDWKSSQKKKKRRQQYDRNELVMARF